MQRRLRLLHTHQRIQDPAQRLRGPALPLRIRGHRAQQRPRRAQIVARLRQVRPPRDPRLRLQRRPLRRLQPAAERGERHRFRRVSLVGLEVGYSDGG